MKHSQLLRVADAVAFRADGWLGLRRRDFDAGLLREVVSAHECSPTSILKDDERSRVTAVRAGETPVIVKEVRKGGFRRRLADAVRGAPARRGFAAGYALREAGVGAALPLAFVERSRGGVPFRSLLVSSDLRPFSTAAARAELDPALVMDRLCDLLIGLHRGGFVHGDLRAQHVHLCGPELVPNLIDLEGVTFGRRISDLERMEALAEINASLSDETVSGALRARAFSRYADLLPFASSSDDARQRVIEMSLHRRHLWRGDRSCGG